MKFDSYKNARIVRSGWLEEGGRRLDCNPYFSGAQEARDAIERLAVLKENLCDVTRNIYDSGRQGRNWVEDIRFGIPFMGSSAIILSDLSSLPLISNRQVAQNQKLLLKEGASLITRSGAIGRMAYVRPDMAGLACSEDVLRVEPNELKILPGYLFAFLSSKYGVPLIISGTYGAIIQHIEPEHIEKLPVPRFEVDFETEVHSLIVSTAKNRSNAQSVISKLLVEFEEEAGFINEKVGTATDFSISSVKFSNLHDRLDAPYHSESAIRAEELLNNGNFDVENLPNVVERYFKPPIFKRLWVESSEFGPLFVSGNDIYRYQPEEERYVSRRTPKFDEFILKRGWVAFQAAGQIYGLFGRPLFIHGWLEETFCADDVFRIVPCNEIDGAFLFLFFRTKVGQALIKRQACGNSIPRVWEPHVSGIRVPWPDPVIRAKFGKPIIEAHIAIEAARQTELKAVSMVEARIRGLANG